MSLATLHCEGCGAAAPLVAAAAIDCHRCGRSIAVPAAWRAAAEGHAAAAQVRREVEPRWQQLAVGVGKPVLTAAKALLLMLPPLSTWLVQSRMVPPPTPVENFGYVAFPALLPGALLWLWATTVNTAVLRVRRDVSAHEAAGALACRSCGAPLAPEPAALATTCLYCGTDSLVRDLPASTRARDHAVRTLAEAADVLRRRRLNLGVGVALLGVGVAAMVVAAALALSLAFGL